MSWWQIAWSIIGIILVIVAAYFTTYIIASRGGRRTSGGGIRLLDNFAMSRDKSVCSLEISGKVYIVAMSSGAIALLDTVDAAQYLKTAKSAPPSPVSFEAFRNSSIFSKFMDAARRGQPTDSSKQEDFETQAPPKMAREEDDLDIISQKIELRRHRPGAQGTAEENGKWE